MKELQPVNLDNYYDLAKIKKEIAAMNKKVNPWLVGILCAISAISYFIFAISGENRFIGISSMIIFLLTLAPTAYFGIRKFDQVVARSSIENPSTLYNKLCIQICLWADFVNAQIAEFNSILINQSAGELQIDLLEQATALESKKRQLNVFLENLYRAKSVDFHPNNLKTMIAELEEKIRFENQIKAITIE